MKITKREIAIALRLGTAQRLYESMNFQKRDQRKWYADNVGRTDFFLYELVLRDPAPAEG